MRKLLLLLVSIILFLSSCGKANNNDSHSQIISDGNNKVFSELTRGEDDLNENNNSNLASSKESVDKYGKIFSRVSNKNHSDIITESYTEEQIFKSGFFYHRFNIARDYNPTMSMLDKHFNYKIECLRQYNEENYYCIYKTKENGFFYCFFSKVGSEFMLYNSCYMKDLLKKSDFKNIKVGDGIESVTKIDSAFLSIYNYYISVESPLTESVHLLEDGLLMIEYENDVIKSVDFNDDFIYSQNGIEYSYKILKEDYPPQ